MGRTSITEEQAYNWGVNQHARLEGMTVPEIQQELKLAEAADFLTTPLMRDLRELALIVLTSHLEMRQKNEPKRWLRETQ